MGPSHFPQSLPFQSSHYLSKSVPWGPILCYSKLCWRDQTTVISKTQQEAVGFPLNSRLQRAAEPGERLKGGFWKICCQCGLRDLGSTCPLSPWSSYSGPGPEFANLQCRLLSPLHSEARASPAMLLSILEPITSKGCS